MTVKNTATEVKLSAPVSGLATKLRKIYTEQAPELKGENHIKIVGEALNDFLEGYTTKVSTGAEVGVTLVDIEKVTNFREDFQQAQRFVSIDPAFELFGKDEKADRFVLRTDLTENLYFTNTLYRPGSDTDTGAEFSAMTDHGQVSADSKAITKHLTAQRKAFLAE